MWNAAPGSAPRCRHGRQNPHPVQRTGTGTSRRKRIAHAMREMRGMRGESHAAPGHPSTDGRARRSARSTGLRLRGEGPTDPGLQVTQVMWTTCGTARRNGFGRSGENGDDESHRGRPRQTRDDGRRAEVDKASFSTKGTHDPAADRTGSRERRETRAREPTWPAREAAARYPYGHRKERQRSEVKAQGSCRLAGRSRRRWR
jgi:hypothetical protein